MQSSRLGEKMSPQTTKKLDVFTADLAVLSELKS